MQLQPRLEHNLVLVGGGHSHVQVLKSLAMRPIEGLQVTLVTRDIHTPYSGMLPGYVAGIYDYDQSHIDLQRLADYANVRLIHAPVQHIDPQQQQVICADRPPIPYQALSINIGSTPQKSHIAGAESDRVIAAKPVDIFLRQWQQIKQQAATGLAQNIAIVGGGAGGVEIALSMQQALNAIAQNKTRLVLYSEQAALLTGHNGKVQKAFLQRLTANNISVRLSCPIASIDDSGLHSLSGEHYQADKIIWVTYAGAPTWLTKTGLALDDKGFIQVNAKLQSRPYDNIFASGDIASLDHHSLAKAGVYAVRQGKVLSFNLRQFFLDKNYKNYRPQKKFLSLLGTGERSAVASRGNLYLQGQWLWRWKDWIDQRFMAQFNDLPSMQSSDDDEDNMRCAGCAAKVGGDILAQVMDQLAQSYPSVISARNKADDAAVNSWSGGQLLIQSIDYFRSFISDPYLFGRISTLHSLNDIYAMGATPKLALALASIPFAKSDLMQDDLLQVMSGCCYELDRAKVQLVGGHSNEGAEFSFGLSVTGADNENTLLNKAIPPGEFDLILTKPLGTATIFAGAMRGKAKGRWTQQAIATMLLSNAAASEILGPVALACTDVTGFGLMGHLQEMLANGLHLTQLNLSKIPLLEGAASLNRSGIHSSLYPQNLAVAQFCQVSDSQLQQAAFQLLFDPQTSGGLLAAVPSSQSQDILQQLKQQHYHQACCIGTIGISPGPVLKPILIQA